jgi:hypothetical protein
MTTVTLNIPDNEVDFFMTLVKKFNYQSISPDVKISDEMKTLLDDRRNSSREEQYIPWNVAKKQLQYKS